MTEIERFRQKISRPAVVLDIGGFRPPDDPMASWFGKVNFLGVGESWPEQEGVPMKPLAQVNFTSWPLRPPGTEDIAFLVLFVGEGLLSANNPPNGKHWCLRTYASLEELTPVATLAPPAAKPFPMRRRDIESDYPSWEDLEYGVPEELEESYHDDFRTAEGFKFGGWPLLIQSEIFWAPSNAHPALPRYVFQVDSCEKAHCMWGDGGVLYFGRGTRPGSLDEWTFEWQCH